jgi:hypothetical protein
MESTEEARCHGGKHSKSWRSGAAYVELDGQLGRNLFSRPNHDIDGHTWRSLADTRAFLGSRDEGGSETILGGCFEIAAVGRAHHALTGLEIEGINGRKVDRRLRFVVAGQIGAEDGIPMNVIPARKITHERYVPIRDWRDKISLPKLRETGRNVFPGVKAVPCKRQLIQRGRIELFESEARQNLLQHSSMQNVKLRIRNAARSDLLHTGLIFITPCICERLPINGISAGSQDGFRVAGYSSAPINQGTEDVEEQRLDDARRKRWLRFRVRRQHALQGRTNDSSRYGQG